MDNSDKMIWIVWECPNCKEENESLEFLEIHCNYCGLVVIVYADGAQSQNWHVEVTKTHK
jgi:DNA-directed RNA polymerase subunit RPC12/RpoP